MIKCKGKDYNGDTCRNNIKDDTNFCKYHYYMKDYTEDMLNNLTYCSGCKKYNYIIYIYLFNTLRYILFKTNM